MDKLIETPWFVKVIALSLAALLYISVNFEPESELGGLNTPSSKGTEVVESVPVELYYDRDNLVVTGAPKTVNVTLEGPKNLVIPAKNNRDFKVRIDLSDPEIELGNKRVPIQISGDLSDKITYTINPSYAEVSIQEKVTRKFKVEPEFNRSLLEDGYFAEEPKVKPEYVEVTGAKDELEKIAYVKATINIEEGVKDTVQMTAPVQALDRNLNKLDVIIAPGVVEVEVPIKSESKTMDINPVASGRPKEGITISSITAEPNEITLFGKKSVLDSINELQIPIDVSKIESNAVFTVPVDLPEGINAASVQEVKVSVSVSKTGEETPEENEEEEPTEGEVSTSKTFADLRIMYVGLDEEYDLVFLSPKEGITSVSVTGKLSDLNSLKASDIQVSINVDGLEEGEHTAPIQIKTPANVKGQATSGTARISITKKTEETS